MCACIHVRIRHDIEVADVVVVMLLTSVVLYGAAADID